MTCTRPLIFIGGLLAACGGAQSTPETTPNDEEAGEVATGEVAADEVATGEGAGPLGIPNERNPLPKLTTGGQPDGAALERAQGQGVSTVISLRTAGEPGSEGEQQRVEALGMRFHSLPIAGADDLTEDNARALDGLLKEAGDGEVVLHCGSGNRAGALLALRAYFVDGRSVSESLALGDAAGLTRLRESVEAILLGACEADTARDCD